MSTVNSGSNVVKSESVVVRCVAKKKFAKIEKAYLDTVDAQNLCVEKIESLKEILKTRKTTVVKDNKEIEVNLRPAQLTGIMKQLLDSKEMLYILNGKISHLSKTYRGASRKTVMAKKHKILGMQERRRLAGEAQRNLEPIKAYVSALFIGLEKAKDKEIASFRELATSNGRKFHLEFMKALRREVKEPKMKSWISASPKVQGELSRLVRALFGYKK